MSFTVVRPESLYMTTKFSVAINGPLYLLATSTFFFSSHEVKKRVKHNKKTSSDVYLKKLIIFTDKMFVLDK